jgi:outer membrane protein TolC
MSIRVIAFVVLGLSLLVGAAHAQAPAQVPAQPVVQPVPEPPGTSLDLEAVLRGEGRGLTADVAAARAIETSPTVDRARATHTVARASVDRALYGFIPQLALSFRYTRLSEITNATLFQGDVDPGRAEMIAGLIAGVDDAEAQALHLDTYGIFAGFSNVRFPVILDQFAINATLTYPLSDVFFQVWPAYEGAQMAAEAQEISIDAQQEEVALQAREAFYTYARARGSLAVARIALEQAETRHTQVQAFVAAGTAARVDELRIRAQVAAARVAVARTTGFVELAATAVRTLLHLEPGADIAVGEDVLAELPPLPGPSVGLVEQAIENRDDARALRRFIDASGRQVDAAEGSRYPHLAVRANLDVANPNQRIFPQTAEFRESWDISAVLQWSPHDLLIGEAAANEARGRRAEAQANLRALEDGIRIQVVDASIAYSSAREALEAAHLGVEAAEESHRVQMERYRAGASTVSDVIDASAEQVRAQLDLVNTAIDARIAWARLQRALGTGVPQ